MDDDTNWLRLRRITCPDCQRSWHRIDRSPMADDWRLYRNQCGNSVEVSYYDLHVTNLSAADLSHLDHLRTIEAELRPCDCGGRYRHDSPRRCAYCLTILIFGESGVDLYPFIYDFEATDRDPTPEEQAEYSEFEKAHIRHTNIWAAESGDSAARSMC